MSRLDERDEELLQSALATSFTRLPEPDPAPAPQPVPADEQTPPTDPSVPSVTPAPSSESSTGLEDSWQEQYNRQVAQWRADSAIAREKAEKTRAEWEERRKAEEEQERREAARKKSEKEATLSGWETVSPTEEKVTRGEANSGGNVGVGAAIPGLPEATRGAGMSGSTQHTRTFGPELVTPAPIRADAKDLVSVGAPSSGPKPSLSKNTADESSGASEEEDARMSRTGTWEEINSLASSFPSLPENISPSTQEKSPGLKGSPGSAPGHHRHHHRHQPRQTDERHHQQHRPQVPGPSSVTSAIFNPNLSAKTRVLALLSSITINMFLPFVNGVMLGFGEIFARNVIGPYFGWKPPGNVGIRGAGGSGRRRDREARGFFS